jgi:hypothetical protein
MQRSSICLTAAAAILLPALLTGCQQQKAPEGNPAMQQTDNPPAAPTATQVAGTPSGTVMTPEYVAAVGRFAYIWGWPLVNNLNRSLGVKDLPGPGRMGGVAPVAPPGHISMLTDYISADQHMITCPNQDTVYGSGYQHVDTLPVVVQVPDFGNRFFVYQIADARTNSFGSIGKQYGTKPGFYAIVGPNWKGTIPSDITGVLHSSTDLVVVLPRIFMDDTPEDKAAIQPLLNQVVLYPLSEFDGKMKTMDWKSTPSFPAPPSTGGETKWVIPEKFFDELQVILKQVPPMPGEEALYATFQSVLDVAQKDPKLKQTLTQTAVAAEKDLISPLFDFHMDGRPIGNGWNSPPNGANWGYDYLSRAATAKSNMYDNAPQETRYIYTDFDSGGQRLNGAHSYTVTFPAGQTPPVDGFWSLTLYNKEHLFAPNSLNRFSLGTKSKSMKTNADGSLTIYVQNTSPGADKQDNWLPAPKDNFSLYIRAYWPKAEITEGKWTPPLVEAAH